MGDDKNLLQGRERDHKCLREEPSYNCIITHVRKLNGEQQSQPTASHRHVQEPSWHQNNHPAEPSLQTASVPNCELNKGLLAEVAKFWCGLMCHSS